MEDNKKLELREVFEELALFSKEEGFYCDINYFEVDELNLNLDKVNTDVSKGNDKGIKFRVFDGGRFLEFAQTTLNCDELRRNFKNLIKKAKKNLEGLEEKVELKADVKEVKEDFYSKADDSNLSLEEKVDVLKGFRDRILKISDVVNARVVLFEEEEENLFVNQYKSLYQKISSKTFVMVAFVNCDGETKMVYESFVDNDFSVLERAENKFNEFVLEIANYKKAKKLKGGKYKVVLAPHLTGLLAHESFGHGMESDTMFKDRALASEFLGKKIGEDFINIVDYPQIEGKHGEFFFDHEGNLAKKTYLVKNGVINEPMADSYTRTFMDLKSSSNSRFESFDHKNYVRMSNTYFEPGNSTFEELVSQVEDGILITGSSGGMEDPKGWGVQIQGNFGQRIKNGKLVDEFFDGFALTGFLPDIVKNISGISKDFEIEGGGRCGKGHKEWVRVSEGGPYMLIDEVILG